MDKCLDYDGRIHNGKFYFLTACIILQINTIFAQV
jgi:hypothetical protein